MRTTRCDGTLRRVRIDPDVFGLCASCVNCQVVRNARGSVFVLCELSRTDPRFRKYPTIPVLACDGYRRREQVDDAG